MARYYLEHYGFVGEDKPYLAHHGIEGMRWGKRNGPPYPLSDAKHNKVVKKSVGGLFKNKHKAALDKRKREFKSEEDVATIEEAKKYKFTPDIESPSKRGFVSVYFDEDDNKKIPDCPDGFVFRVWEPSSDKYNFKSIDNAKTKYLNNHTKIRSDAIKIAKQAGIYDDLLDNDFKPGKVAWDDNASISGDGGLINISTWAMGDHIQTFHYYVKNGKIEIGPMDG